MSKIALFLFFKESYPASTFGCNFFFPCMIYMLRSIHSISELVVYNAGHYNTFPSRGNKILFFLKHNLYTSAFGLMIVSSTLSLKRAFRKMVKCAIKKKGIGKTNRKQNETFQGSY